MIKKLQNNFTTPEQSKRLLELGVPSDSADCVLENLNTEENNFQSEYYTRWIIEKRHVKEDIFCERNEGIFLPCWSVGRLMEILSHCYNWDEYLDVKFIGGSLWIPRYTHKDNYLRGAVGFIVREIENAIMTNNIDFSKLEE